jgi:hypothetical protein
LNTLLLLAVEAEVLDMAVEAVLVDMLQGA